MLIPVPDNYGRWENIMAANPDAVGAVGLCSIDIPNLAQLKERTGGTWLIGGYDLDPPTLQAIKDGWAQVTVGQQEYLQGYLPVRAARGAPDQWHAAGRGWLETPTEVVTAENVDDYVSRQTDDQVQHEYYQRVHGRELRRSRGRGPAIRRSATPGNGSRDPGAVADE